ncbi:nucleotidyltransferase domain-containing protein [Halobacillus fulvus]|nr:nucleotidyltransferase domain-containing protein [Halobacillus fulvus]
MLHFIQGKLAREFIKQFHPDCKTALLAGSTVRGDQTSTSDLDLVIIGGETIRRSCLWKGVPVESFVYDEDSLDYHFFVEQQHGVPLLIRMCADGVILEGAEFGKELIAEGKKRLEEGPVPLTAEKSREMRYIITDLLEDLEGSASKEEDLFTVAALTDQLHRFVLRMNKKWVGEGKWMYRSLKAFSPDFARKMSGTLTHYYQSGEKGELVAFTDQILASYGGRLFHDFSQ